MKKNQQIGRKSNSKDLECGKRDYKLPFETPIPVGTRQEKSRKKDIKDYGT
nr:hypothetical protein [Mycoplasmopsis bovis]